MSQTVVIDGEITLKAKIDGEINLASMIDGDLGVMLGADGLEFEYGEYKPSGYLLEASISFRRQHSAPPAIVVLSDATGANRQMSSNMAWIFTDYSKISDAPIVATDERSYYAVIDSAYKSSPSSIAWIRITVDSDNYANVTAEGFTARIEPNGMTTRWQSGVPYKWIAVWR